MKIRRITIRRIVVLPKICSVESPLLPKICSVECPFLLTIRSVKLPYKNLNLTKPALGGFGKNGDSVKWRFDVPEIR